MALQLPGAYARFEGAEFRVSRGADGELTIATGDAAWLRAGFVDVYGTGVLQRVVVPDELERPYRLHYSGRWDGVEVSVGFGSREVVRVAVGDGATAERLGFPRVDQYLWEVEVTLGDPRLEVTAHREPWDPSVVTTEQRER